MLLFLLACADPEVEEWKCVGPLVELVRWRDEQESQRTWGGKAIVPADLARLERERVTATVETLRPRRSACELTWNLLTNQPAENPGLRLREEAISELLGLPPRDYGAQAVGWAGVTVSGRAPVGK